MREQVFIFDVCGTLVRDDTTVGLLSWHFRRRGFFIRERLVKALFGDGLLNFLVRGLEFATRLFFARKLAIFLLRGESPEEVLVSAKEYAQFLLAHRLEHQVFEMFQQFREQGVVVLASASVDPVINALGSILGVDALSSELEIGSSGYTGYLTLDLIGKKPGALLSRYGEGFFDANTTVVSDNFSDAELLAMCDTPWVVLRKSEHRFRWSLEGARYLEAAGEE